MTTLSGKPLLTIQPDFASDPKIIAHRPADAVELGEAPRLVAFPSRSALHRLYHEFMPDTLEEVLDLEDFFYDRAGKWGAFYVPSWHGELRLIEDLLNGQSSMVIESVGYADLFLRADSAETLLGGHVFLFNTDGDLHASRVTAAVDEGSGSGEEGTGDTLTLEDAPSADFLVGQCFCGFVYHVRFLQDEFVARFTGPHRAVIQLAMQECLPVVAEPDAGCVGTHEFFEDYEEGEVSLPASLNLGCGWTTGPSVAPNLVASVAREFFESAAYEEGAVTGEDLDRGAGWVAAPDIAGNYPRSAALETFESYSLGGGGDLDEGTGWAGGPSITINV